MVIKQPRPLLSACLASISIFGFAAIAVALLWVYRGAHFTVGELKILVPIYSIVAVIGIIASFLPLSKLRDEYRYSRVKFRFYTGSDVRLEEIEMKLNELGYKKIGDGLFVHDSFPDLSSYKDKKTPSRHFLEIHSQENNPKIVLKAWPTNKLASADWRLTIHDSLGELGKKVFYKMNCVSYSEVMKNTKG